MVGVQLPGPGGATVKFLQVVVETLPAMSLARTPAAKSPANGADQEPDHPVEVASGMASVVETYAMAPQVPSACQ